MADLKQEQVDEVNRPAEPASKEAEILGCNQEVEKEEVKLPKLSAAEFRTYNSMAEHMEYFVSSLQLGYKVREIED